MGLPTIHSATHQITLPSNSKKINIRSATVGEQKELLIAQKMNDPSSVKATIKSLLKRCIIDDINIDLLPAIDFEFIYVMIMVKSSGEVSKFSYVYKKCPRDDGPCKKNISLNLQDIKIGNNENHNDKIKLSNEYSIELKYPTIDIIDDLTIINKDDLNSFDNMVTIIARSIKTVYSNINEDDVYPTDGMKLDDLRKFVLGLEEAMITKIMDFFNTMPYLHYKNEFKCPDCGENIVIEFKGLSDFFQ
jgi:hypothetical protein